MIVETQNCKLSVNLIVSSSTNSLSTKRRHALANYCKYVLRNNPGYQCRRKENKQLKEVFQMHPRWNVKGKDFSFVTVEMSCFPPHKCFFIHRKDGSVIDISYRKCLGLSKSSDRCEGTKIVKVVKA